MSELAGFKAPSTIVAYGLSITPEGTVEPNPMPPYVFNRRFSSWRNHERPINEIGHTNLGTLARPTF